MPRGRFAMDLSPLRGGQDFRLLFAGFLGALIGTLMTSVAVAWQVYDLTGSSAQVGLVSLARAVPLVVGVLAGGVLADRYDRRLLMLATRLPLTLVAVALTANALLPDPHLWLIYVATGVTGLLAGLGGPAMLAAIPALVGTERLAAAGALTASSAQLAALLGPAIGGVLVAGPGLAACFAVDAAGFLVFSLALLFVRPLRPQPRTPPKASARRSPPWGSACGTYEATASSSACCSSTPPRWSSRCRRRSTRSWPTSSSTAAPASWACCTPHPRSAPSSARPPAAGRAAPAVTR